MDLGLAGASAVITGGSKGMGRATAQCLAEEGARVAVLARGKEAIDDTVAALKAAGSPDAVGIPTDATRPEDVDAAFAEIERRWDGELNILVNTLGPGAGRFEDMDDKAWDATMDIGLMAAVRCTRAALPMLRRAPWARIVNFSAHSVQRQSPMLVAYTASKAALSSFSKNLAKTLAPEGILVNTICPGTIVTAAFTEMLKPMLAEIGLDSSDPHDVMRWIDDVFHPPADLGRAGMPDEVGAVTAFFASPRNGYVTGASINVDGGSDFV